MVNRSAVDAVEPLRLRPPPEIIADRICEQILTGAFAAGTRIAEVPLSARLGVSRGPVREALQRLVQEGLAVNTQNKGVCVVDLQVEDLVDIYVARRAVEREAFQRAFRLKTDTLIAERRQTGREMEISLAADNWRIYVDQNTRFHSLIVDAARSPRLSRIYSTLSAEFRLCTMKEKPLHTYPTGLPEDHSRLIDLLERGPVSALLAELDRHLNGGIERLSEISTR